MHNLFRILAVRLHTWLRRHVLIPTDIWEVTTEYSLVKLKCLLTITIKGQVHVYRCHNNGIYRLNNILRDQKYNFQEASSGVDEAKYSIKGMDSEIFAVKMHDQGDTFVADEFLGKDS